MNGRIDCHPRCELALKHLAGDVEFTQRESEVILLVLGGKSDKSIAIDLGLSRARVRQLVGSSFSKIGVSTRNELIYALCVSIHGK